MLRSVYEGELHGDYIALHLGQNTTIAGNMIPFLREGRSPGRLLDIGCGDGSFLEEAKRYGHDVWGLDFDTKSITVAREKRKLQNVYACSVQEFLELASEKHLLFDYITLFEVLEHQDNPIQFLKSAKSLLKPNGFIAGSVPNRKRFWPNFSDWAFGYGDRPPHHFTRWSKEVLSSFLKRNGFVDADVTDVCRFSLIEASLWWERIILGNLINKIRFSVKKRIAPDDRSAHLRMQQLEELLRPKQRRFTQILKTSNHIVQHLQKTLFLPAALVMLPLMNRTGRNLYFEARHEGSDALASSA